VYQRSVVLLNVAPVFAAAYQAEHPNPLYRPVRSPLHPSKESYAPIASDIPLAHETQTVLLAAWQEAHESGHDYIGTRHLLAALRTTPTEAAHALGALGIEEDQIRAPRESKAPSGVVRQASAELPYTPAVRRAISRAEAEAREHGHGSIRAAHLLLGILREPDNEAVQILLDLGISPEEAARRSADAIRLLESVMIAAKPVAPDAIAPETQSR